MGIAGMPLTQYLDLPRLRNMSPGAVAACALLFVTGMALLGSASFAGGFYIASLLLGLYLLWRLPRVRIVVPPAVRYYLGFYLAFVALVLVHIVVFSTSTSHIDQVSRIGLGVLNGFTFLALLGFSREKLFELLVLVAAAHAAVAVAVAFWQGIDFASLSLAAERAHGITNPIPFSEMLATSIGVVALAIAGRMDSGRLWGQFLLLAFVVAIGAFAVFLTGTRGTLIGFLLLLFLLWIVLLGRVKLWLAAVFTVPAIMVVLAAGSFLLERDAVSATTLLDLVGAADVTDFHDDSIGIRLQLWSHALDLIAEAPLLGHGISSFPDVLRAPELGVSENSVLFTFSNVHNQYLDMVMKMGLVGAALFFMPLFISLGVGLRLALHRENRVAGLTIIWVGGSYAVYGLTQTFYGHASTTLHYGVYLGMLMWLTPGGRYGDVRQPPETVS